MGWLVKGSVLALGFGTRSIFFFCFWISRGSSWDFMEVSFSSRIWSLCFRAPKGAMTFPPASSSEQLQECWAPVPAGQAGFFYCFQQEGFSPAAGGGVQFPPGPVELIGRPGLFAESYAAFNCTWNLERAELEIPTSEKKNNFFLLENKWRTETLKRNW